MSAADAVGSGFMDATAAVEQGFMDVGTAIEDFGADAGALLDQGFSEASNFIVNDVGGAFEDAGNAIADVFSGGK